MDNGIIILVYTRPRGWLTSITWKTMISHGLANNWEDINQPNVMHPTFDAWQKARMGIAVHLKEVDMVLVVGSPL